MVFTIHKVFQKALESLGSDEQIAKWGPMCKQFQIICTYAQTELGHGESGPCVVSVRYSLGGLKRLGTQRVASLPSS